MPVLPTSLNMYLPAPKQDSGLRPVYAALMILVCLGINIYALFGVFAGYLIIPNRRDGVNPDVIEGMPARFAGLAIMCVTLSILFSSNNENAELSFRDKVSRWMLWIALTLIGAAVVSYFIAGETP